MPILKKGINLNAMAPNTLQAHLVKIETAISPKEQPKYLKAYLKDKTQVEKQKLIAAWKRTNLWRKNVLIASKRFLVEIRREFPFVKGAYIHGSVATSSTAPKDLDMALVIDYSKLPFALHINKNDYLGLSRYFSRKFGQKINVQGRNLRPDFAGFLFFDSKNPKITSDSLIECKVRFRGQTGTHELKHKLAFDIRPWYFVGTDKKIVDMFIEQWNKVKNMKFI